MNREWQDEAACRDLAPAWDNDFYESKTPHPLRWRFLLAEHAVEVCVSECSVRRECSAWHDARMAAGEALDCIAGGDVYKPTRDGRSYKVAS